MKKKIERRPNTADPMAEDFLYTVGWSEDDAAYVARVAEFPSLAAHGNTQQAALRSVQQVVKAVLKDMATSKEPIPQPLGKLSFSGRIAVSPGNVV